MPFGTSYPSPIQTDMSIHTQQTGYGVKQGQKMSTQT